MVTRLGVEHKRLLPGCSAGLAERTAVVDLRYAGQWNREAGERIRAGVTTLCPEEPLYGVCESDWPAAFLAERVDPLGDWVVAVTVGLQQWARDPVWRGRVVSSGAGRLRLAIPWRREAIFGDALELAVRLIERWSAPTADRPALGCSLAGARAPSGWIAVSPAEPAETLPVIDSYGGRFTG